MTADVHVNRSRESQLPVLQDDGVLVLRDAIDGAIERPVEDDARRLAAHARVALREEHRELFSALLALGREFSALNHAGAAATRAARATDPPLSWLVLTDGAERHERAPSPTRVRHDELLWRPVA